MTEKRQQAADAVRPIVERMVEDLASAGTSIQVEVGDPSIEEARAIVHNPQPGMQLTTFGFVEAENDDEEPPRVIESATYQSAKVIAALVDATGLSRDEVEHQVEGIVDQWNSFGGELFTNLLLKLVGPDGEAAFYINADGWKVGPAEDLERLADPLHGEELADEEREIERKLTREELDVLLEEFDAAKLREGRAEMDAKHARTLHKEAKDALDEVGERLLRRTITTKVKCPVRLRNGRRVVLHPDTLEVLYDGDLTDADRQLTLPEHATTDEADGIDRVQIRARLMQHEHALSIPRGVHAVPPQVEIDTWSTGVCRATVEWLDSIDGDGVLKPLPIWVTGLRAEQQTGRGRHKNSQMSAAVHQIAQAFGALIDGTLDELPFGRVRLDLATVVAQMKRERVAKGTSQHLTAVLRMVGDCGGWPQFSKAADEAEGARLRLLYFIAKAKPAADGMADDDLRPAILAEVERMLGVSK